MAVPRATRRQFTKALAASVAYSLIPHRVLGANEKVNVACIGIGGQGAGDCKWLASTNLANIVALCDVDTSKRTAEIRGLNPDAKTYTDFRQLFAEMGDQIDAALVCVPDHSHFPVAMLAMSLGKHVYVEKPLANTFREAELLIAAEQRYGVAAQMGNQGHSGANYFQFKEWVEAGIIKDVTRVDAYMNDKRRWHGWSFDAYPAGEACPATFDWERWLTVGPEQPYSKYLANGNWRGWFDYGNGAFGDWGPHTLDTVHRFLELGLPTEIEARRRDKAKNLIFPLASTIRFHFPARGDKPPVDITWYDGADNLPPRPPELEEGREIEKCGKIIYSKELVFKGTTHGSALRIIPEQKMKDLAEQLPRTRGKNSSHMQNFLLACKGEEQTRSNFAVAGPLTQVFLLGVLAQRFGDKLLFDPATKRITNHEVADRMLAGPPPRPGWEEFYRL